MQTFDHFKEKIKNLSEVNFEEIALELFNYQAKENDVYNAYLRHLNIKPGIISQIRSIPFLPIQFFKYHDIKTETWNVQKVFKSSGTTRTGRSSHSVRDLSFYHQLSFKRASDYFGDLSQLQVCGLLPSYQEQGDSSLIEMVNYFSHYSLSSSGFYLKNTNDLIELLDSSDCTILLFGVSYALIDLAEQVGLKDWSRHIFVETGGMKGRKKEITRHELHHLLKKAFSAKKIHTEYGMTELMSQAYGTDGLLSFPKWAKALVRDLNDPFDLTNEGSGGLNVIDIANIHSCAFIETGDIGKIYEDGKFEVLGRLDNSDIRGCSLLI